MKAAMPEAVIQAHKLSKVYRLYKQPTDRLRDAFGLLKDATRYTEHVALDGIDLVIRRGEKVGIIGRNGAGKSTFLKLVTKTISPTSGQLEVKGATQALLQIGTGFHPEFTGRDNVISYLAQLGIAGEKAARLTREIIEFAEVEEYIDQPVKTYSTGMGARLMFAASTVIEPDVLVIDEVLGVGDAYFARKSYERIKALCAEHHATLLLVSHDVYSSAQICDRMVWIDKGRIKFDGEPKACINLYESSIKEQEEQRLRRKAMLAPAAAASAGSREVIVEIKSRDGQPLKGTLFLYETALADGHESLGRVDPFKGASDAETARQTGNSVALVYEGSNWLTVDEAGRSDGIVLANYGQPYHKGSLRMRFRSDIARPTLALQIESAAVQSLVATVFDERQIGHAGGSVDLKQGARTEWLVPLDTAKLERTSDRVEAGQEARHGSGAIRITGVDIKDADGKSTRQLVLGSAYELTLSYLVNDPIYAKSVEVNIAIFRDGVSDVMRMFGTELDLSRGRLLTAAIDELTLAPGTYQATILVAKSGYYAVASGIPYSLSPDVFDALPRSLGFSIAPCHPAFMGTISMQRAKWSIRTHQTDEFAAPSTDSKGILELSAPDQQKKMHDTTDLQS